MTQTPEAARRYARIRYRLLLVQVLWSAAVLWAAQASGLSRAMGDWWSGRWPHPAAALFGVLATLGAGYYAALLPVHIFGSFVLEHRFGLSRMTVRGWIIKELKSIALSGALGIAMAEGFFAILRHAPSAWPVWAAAGWILVTVVMARVFPTLLLPIFYKTVPLPDQDLVHRLLDLCRRVGLPALGVFRFDLGAETRKANAALAGLGGTRRVLVSDTLVQEFSVEEIEGVLAHELGHHKHRHIPKQLALESVGTWLVLELTRWASPWWIAAFDLRGLADPAGLPALALWLSLVRLLGMPLQNGFSRYCEWQSDRFAIATTTPAALAGALRRLGALNLADPSPPRWVVWLLYTHPPITDRVRAADAAAQA
jgi:STE24 endopeptidase